MITRMLTTASLLVLTGCQHAWAQRKQFDPTTENYRVRYHSSSLGREVTIDVEPPNKVDPVLALTAVRLTPEGRYVYTYRLENRRSTAARRGVRAFELPCPPASDVTAQSASSQWVSRAGGPSQRVRGAHFCRFSEDTDNALLPGNSAAGFTIETKWALKVDSANFWGVRVPTVFPVGDDPEHDEELHKMIAFVDGTLGGWASRLAVVPAYDPSSATPSALFAALQSNAADVCDNLGWLETGECSILRPRLQSAHAAYNRGAVPEARTELAAFLTVLRQGNDRDAGRSFEGRWLLRSIAEHLLSRL